MTTVEKNPYTIHPGGWNKDGYIMQGNVMDCIKDIHTNSIDTIITSPPYYRQRTNDVIVTWDKCMFGGAYVPHGPKGFGDEEKTWISHCKSELGQESTEFHYLHHLMYIFKECRRVLKDSGNLFVVIDDTADNGDLMIPERFCLMMKDALGFSRKGDFIWKENNKLPKGGAAANRKVVRDYEHVYHFVKDFSKSYFKQLYEPYSKITMKEFETFYNKEGTKDYESQGVQNPSKVKANIINRKRKFAPIGGINKYNNNNSIDNSELATNVEFTPDKEGRLMRSIWEINHNCLPKDILHFSAFPKELVSRLIDLGCPPEGNVLDPFMGSGTVAVVAEQKRRYWIGIEANEDYIKAIKIRLERGK